MAGIGEKVWLERAQKAALDRGHTLVLTESDFSSGNARITVFCEKCKTKTPNILLRSYLQLTSESSGCIVCAAKKNGSRFPLSEKTLQKIQATKKTKDSFGKPCLGLKGKAHPCFRNGNTRMEGSASFKNTIFTLYSGKCYVTGETEKLEIHHLESINNHPDKASETNNGVLIQRSIHKAFHNEYGYGNNTREQFEEFIFLKYGIKIFPWRGLFNEQAIIIQKRFISLRDFEKKNLLKNIQSKGHHLIKFLNSENDYLNGETQILVECKSCTLSNEAIPQKHKTTVAGYKKATKTGGLLCCVKKQQKKISSIKQEILSVSIGERAKNNENKIVQMILDRGHIFHGFSNPTSSYENKNTLMKIECNKCVKTQGIVQEIYVRNYSRNEAGLPCCYSEKSKKLRKINHDLKLIAFQQSTIESL